MTLPTPVPGHPSWIRGAEGVALPFLLFLLLALTLLAHGTLLLARREYQASRAFLHASRSQEAARSALEAGLDRMVDPVESVPPDSVLLLLEEELPEGLNRRVFLRWLSPELFLLEGEGGSRGWPGAIRVGGVGWRLDPLTRLRAFRGGVEVGGGASISPGGEISSAGILDFPAGWEEACSAYTPTLDSLQDLQSLPPTAPLPNLYELPPALEPWIPGLGLLQGRRLLDLAEGLEGSSGMESMNGEGCPGGGEPLLRVEKGPLTLEQGRWCGILAVTGDLVLEGSGFFQGLLLTGGALRIQGGWTVQGMARVGGPLEIGSGAGMEVVACPVLRVLEELPGLKKPFLLRGAWNMPLY